MVDFSQTVQPPGGASYNAPILNFSQFANWAADDPYAAKFKQQESQLNDAKLAQMQQQIDLAKAFAGGLPTDQNGQVDYRKAAAILASKGDIGGAVSLLQQQPPAPSPLLGGAAPQAGQPPAAPQGQPPQAIQSNPLPPPRANSPQGDSGNNTITSMVTDKLPSQNQTTGATIMKIAEVMGLDPNADLTPGQVRRAQGLLSKYAPDIAGMSPGQSQQKLPPSVNAVTPGASPGSAAGGTVGAAGAPNVSTPPAPAGAPAPSPQQGQPQQPLVPQVPLPKGFNDPQQAIMALRTEAARYAAMPNGQAQASLLNNWAQRIEDSTKPVPMRPGEALIDPRTGQPIIQIPSTAQQRVNPQMVGEIADGIANGSQPPSLTGLYGMSAPVRAALQERGFDLSKAQLEYKRAEKQIQALNGPQMQRFVGLASSVDSTIDEVRNISQELEQSGIPLLNHAKMEGYIKTRGNTPEGQLYTRYITAVNTLKEEFANLAQGGYAPTEAVWKLANDQINADYGVKQMGASLDEVQRLIRYRINAIPGINQAGPGAANRYTGQQGPQQQTAPPAATASAGGGGAATQKPITKEQYDALQSGETFMAPDGNLRVKP